MDRRSSIPFLLCFGLLLLGVAFLYASSLTVGFIWDDPIWFGHALGKTWWQTLLPMTDFQYYRPLTMLYFWLFRRADGTFAIVAAHGFQVGFHLLNVVLAFAISRRLGLGRGTAVTIAALFAFFPFAYQAVAWAAPQQPLTAVLQNLAWLTYMWARPLSPQPGHRPQLWLLISLLFFVLALAMQESSVAVAVVPLLYELIMRPLHPQRPQPHGRTWRSRWRSWRWAMTYLLLAVLYTAVWLVLPRKAGITGAFFDGSNLPYLLQSVAYPLFGRPVKGYTLDGESAAWLVVVVSVVSTAVLLALAVWRGRGRSALFGLAWAVVAVLPIIVGLGFAYVSLASRLLYAPALGICLLWGCALWPRQSERRIIRVASMGLVGIMLIQSVWLLWQFEATWQAGTSHLEQAVAALDEVGDGRPSDGRLLFLNFPDRYTPEQKPYPIGYWGMTLAPVVVELADFQRVWTGGTAESLSRSMPWVGQAGRENSPYQVDMRGVIIQPDELAALADEVEAVYVSDYLPDGRFQLLRAGHMLPEVAPSCELARFGDAICLHDAQVTAVAGECTLTLVWSAAEPLPPHLTLFTHLGVPGQPPTAQADGDTWRGALPLANWPTHAQIVDERTLPCPAKPGDMAVQIGVYNWVDGARLPGVAVEGVRPLPDDAWCVRVGEVGR